MVGFNHSKYLSIKPIRFQTKTNTLCFLKSPKGPRIIKRSLYLVSTLQPEQLDFPPKSTISKSNSTSRLLVPNLSSKSTKPHLENIHLSSEKSSIFPKKSPKIFSPVTLQVLTQIFKTSTSPDIVTYTNFIKFLGQSDCAAEAFELFVLMKEYHNPDIISFTVLLRILCDSKMFDRALGLFHEMPYYHCKPDIIFYNTLIDKLGEAGEVKQVRKFCSQMEAEGIHADVVTYSSVVKSLCVTKKIDEALVVLRFMEISRMVQPNTYTYNTIIKAYLDRELIKEALGVLGRMKIRGCKPDLCSYNLFIKYYSDVGQGMEAYIVLRKMVRKGIEASEGSYRICIYGLMKQSKVDEVLQLIKEIKLSCVTLCVCSWNNLIMWLEKMGRVDEAYSVFSEMENPDEITINIVIHLLYKHGRGEKAWEVFNLMKERKIEASVMTYNTLIHGLSIEGNVPKAFELANQMEGEMCISPDVVTYNILLNSLCNRQEIEDACRLVLKMLIKGCKPDIISINTLIKGMISAGRMDGASRLYEHMKGDIAAHSVPLGELIEDMLTRK